MIKEKTAMQMLIDSMEHDIKDENNARAKVEIRTWIIEAKKLLQKEQEQIERSYDKGVIDSYFSHETDTPNGKDYYQSKYGGEGVDR